ncbi:MAG: acyltransferase, partial [Bacteroidales bacterium]
YLLLGYYLTKGVKEWSLGKTLAISLPLLTIGYIATYIGFKYMTANPDSTEEQIELFFTYCSPNVVAMAVAVFLMVRKIKISSTFVVQTFAHITKCGFGIYLVHYFFVGLGYNIAEILSIPISIKIPITALIAFALSWVFVGIIYKAIPKVAKWIFG